MWTVHMMELKAVKPTEITRGDDEIEKKKKKRRKKGNPWRVFLENH